MKNLFFYICSPCLLYNFTVGKFIQKILLVPLCLLISVQIHDPGLHLLYHPEKGSRKALAFIEQLAADLKAAGLV